MHIFARGQEESKPLTTPQREGSSTFENLPNSIVASLPLVDFLHPFCAINITRSKIGFSEFRESFQHNIKPEGGFGKLLNLQLVLEVGSVLCPCGWLTLDTVTT